MRVIEAISVSYQIFCVHALCLLCMCLCVKRACLRILTHLCCSLTCTVLRISFEVLVTGFAVCLPAGLCLLGTNILFAHPSCMPPLHFLIEH